MSETPNAPVSPPPLTVAASLVAVEGIALVGVALVQLTAVSGDRQSLGLSNAVFFAGYGVVLLVAARGLWRRSGWSRGPALVTQLIALGVAWFVREQPLAAVGLAVVALVVLAGLLHPDSLEALGDDGSDGRA